MAKFVVTVEIDCVGEHGNEIAYMALAKLERQLCENVGTLVTNIELTESTVREGDVWMREQVSFAKARRLLSRLIRKEVAQTT